MLISDWSSDVCSSDLDAIERHRDIAADPTWIDELSASFPPAMQKSHGQAIQDHQLRGEIIATELADRIVNRLGIIDPCELEEEAGCSLADLSSAFVIAERLFEVPALWRDKDSSTITESARLALLSEIAGAMRAQIADLIRSLPTGDRKSTRLNSSH